MGVLQGLERRLQGAVGNTFARLFGGGVQPAEVVSALQNEAAGHITRQGGRTIAPNHYLVRLGPSDRAEVGDAADRVSAAFGDMLSEYLVERGWETFGEVAVTLEQSDALHTGQFRISSLIDPDVDRRSVTRSAGVGPMTQPPGEAHQQEPGYPHQAAGPPPAAQSHDQSARAEGADPSGHTGDDRLAAAGGYQPTGYPPAGHPAAGYPSAAPPSPPTTGYGPPSGGQWAHPAVAYGQPAYGQSEYPQAAYAAPPAPAPQSGAAPQPGYPASTPQPGYPASAPQPGYPASAPQPGYLPAGPEAYGTPPTAPAQQGYAPSGYAQPALPWTPEPPGHPEFAQPAPPPETPYAQQRPAVEPDQPGYPHGLQPVAPPDPYVGYQQGPSSPPYPPSYPPPPAYPQHAPPQPGPPQPGQYQQVEYQPPGPHQPQAAYQPALYPQQVVPQQAYAPPVTDRQAVLSVDDGSGRTYQLQRGSNIVGRGQEASFRLPDTAVSRRHVDVYFDGQVAVLHDLGSTNGTSVNGSNVKTWQLADGDVIRVGHSTVVFHLR